MKVKLRLQNISHISEWYFPAVVHVLKIRKQELVKYKRLIPPILCYGSEVWCFNTCDTIQRIHSQFLKKILCFKLNTENILVPSELCILNMQCERFLGILRYWLKIVKSNTD